VAVLVGATDMSELFSRTPDTLVYSPRFPLPQGDTEVLVYLVSPENAWTEIARFGLRVARDTPTAAVPRDSGNGRQKPSFTPSITLGIKSQPSEYHYPDANRPDRERYTDVVLQAGLRTEGMAGPIGFQSQFDIAGSSYRNEALRFAQKGAEAPLIDLASYLLQFNAGSARIQMGHVAFGTNRHLINSFSSRGILVTLPVTSRFDVSLGASNGSSIVGWDNFVGLDRRKHQVLSGTLGFEAFPDKPGALRFEGGVLHGSLLPIGNFNQGNITDAEQSKGVSFRVVAADPSQRVRLDAGYARSRFNNPADPLLEQSFGAVPVRETSRGARYIDAGFNILQNAEFGSRRASLSFNYRHERVDPLFRSVASYNQADRFQNQFEVIGTFAGITATVAHHRTNDNLDDIPSILKTLTRRSGLTIGVPLVSLVGDPGSPSPWLPRVSYAFERTHQLGAGVPINSGFSPSHVPDQFSTNQLALAEWQFDRIRFGYRFNNSFQDNQQPGRELADLRNLINGFTVGFSPRPGLDLNLDLNIESAKNFESRRVDRTNRAGGGVNWQMTARSILAASISTIFAADLADTSRSRNAEFDLSWTYRFGVERSRYRKVNGQFYVRYANRYARTLDSVFGLDNLIKSQTLNVGMSFTFF
jgi:hypothetical protein